jgi:hypothetical protein
MHVVLYLAGGRALYILLSLVKSQEAAPETKHAGLPCPAFGTKPMWRYVHTCVHPTICPVVYLSL